MSSDQNESPSSMNAFWHQRRALVGAAVAATVAGAGIAWWRGGQDTSTQSRSEPVDGFWALQWDVPQGGGLIRMADFRGRPLLLNFWATWCPPCVEELPLINAFYNENIANGWQVLGLAVDKASSVQAFLQKMPLEFPVAMAGIVGADLGRGLGNLTGGLPFSVALSADGSVIQRKMGRLTASDLQAWGRLK
jgi:thiol-disulfide isomerase/thioredoxin